MHKGLEREWSFGCNEETSRCDYKIVLKPNSYAYYYDLSQKDETTESFILECTDDADFHRDFNDFAFEQRMEDDEQYKNVNLKEVEI